MAMLTGPALRTSAIPLASLVESDCGGVQGGPQAAGGAPTPLSTAATEAATATAADTRRSLGVGGEGVAGDGGKALGAGAGCDGVGAWASPMAMMEGVGESLGGAA